MQNILNIFVENPNFFLARTKLVANEEEGSGQQRSEIGLEGETKSGAPETQPGRKGKG